MASGKGVTIKQVAVWHLTVTVLMLVCLSEYRRKEKLHAPILKSTFLSKKLRELAAAARRDRNGMRYSLNILSINLHLKEHKEGFLAWEGLGKYAKTVSQPASPLLG